MKPTVIRNPYQRHIAIRSCERRKAADGSVYCAAGTIWLGTVVGLAKFWSSAGKSRHTAVEAMLPDGSELYVSLNGRGSHSQSHITLIINTHMRATIEEAYCAAARGEKVDRRGEVV